MAESNSSPHITEPFAPLETMIYRALRRYGDVNPGTIDGEVSLMFLELANTTIEDIRQHAYWDNETDPLNYYEAVSEIRGVPDNIIVSGLLFNYAIQQGSKKAESYASLYKKTLNQTLYERKYGDQKHYLKRVDATADEAGEDS